MEIYDIWLCGKYSCDRLFIGTRAECIKLKREIRKYLNSINSIEYIKLRKLYSYAEMEELKNV